MSGARWWSMNVPGPSPDASPEVSPTPPLTFENWLDPVYPWRTAVTVAVVIIVVTVVVLIARARERRAQGRAAGSDSAS